MNGPLDVLKAITIRNGDGDERKEKNVFFKSQAALGAVQPIGQPKKCLCGERLGERRRRSSLVRLAIKVEEEWGEALSQCDYVVQVVQRDYTRLNMAKTPTFRAPKGASREQQWLLEGKI